MIGFQDFAPAKLRQGVFSADFEPLSVVVERVNAWVLHYKVRVVNIETVLLPNLERAAQGSHATGVRTAGEVSSYWYQVVRLWYEHDEAPA